MPDEWRTEALTMIRQCRNLGWLILTKRPRALAIRGAIAGAVDLRPWLGHGIDWIVVGGETGAKEARYMEPDWARDLRDQCRDTGADIFLKQMWTRKAIPADLMVREYPAV